MNGRTSVPSAVLVQALRSLGAEASVISDRAAQVSADSMEVVPMPGELQIKLFSNGAHVWTFSCPWRPPQVVYFRGFKMQLEASIP